MITKEELLILARTRKFAVTFASAMSALSGAVAGYQYAHKKLKAQYEEVSEQEIREAKEFYKNLYKIGENDEPLGPEEVLSQLHPDAVEAMKSYSGGNSAVITAGDIGSVPTVKEQPIPG